KAKAAEAERQRAEREKAERETVVAAEPAKTQIAMLPPNTEPVARPLPPGLSKGKLVQAIKKELNRVGCYDGTVDDNWGERGLRRSIKRFVKYGKFSGSADEPSSDFLEALRGSAPAICPLECGARETERDGRCVAKTCPVGEIMRSNGRCVAKTKEHTGQK